MKWFAALPHYWEAAPSTPVHNGLAMIFGGRPTATRTGDAVFASPEPAPEAQ